MSEFEIIVKAAIFDFVESPCLSLLKITRTTCSRFRRSFVTYQTIKADLAALVIDKTRLASLDIMAEEKSSTKLRFLLEMEKEIQREWDEQKIYELDCPIPNTPEAK